MYSFVECDCGHKFPTHLEKPQCGKCKIRFENETHPVTVSSFRKDATIKKLIAKIKKQEQLMEKLISTVVNNHKETAEIFEEFRKL